MRLLKVDSHGEFSLTRDLLNNRPPYAVLSHTWGPDEEEPTFEDLSSDRGKGKTGYAKIRFCGEQARRDGLNHFWVDTCCINKANHNELSGAITSMFSWYKGAEKCYVYLSDVSSRKRDHDGDTQRPWEAAFRNSRWFTRGWTLQELLAPTSVEFFARERQLLGGKTELGELIQEITSIPTRALYGAPLSEFKFQERMRWAETRHTTRIEDKVYCLLGIFQVYMVPIYGEGVNAMTRLKDEIGRDYRSQLDSDWQPLAAPVPLTPKSRSTYLASPPVVKVSPHDRRRQLLASLSFDQADSRRSTIKTAYTTTCSWMLTHQTYKDWTNPDKLHHHHGFLWINGKPGAGKSTLMKSTHAYAEKNRSEAEIVVSFFFNARGDDLEKTTLGMYRALLFQLLNKATDMQQILDYDIHGNLNQGPTWTTESLCELLSTAIASLGQRRLTCFIDALNECDEQQIQAMVIFFEKLGQKALENGGQLYICLASRHYPTIDIGDGEQLILEHEDGHGKDLTEYVRNHLRAGKGPIAERIQTQVQEKANGVFMWAVLVIDILNKEFKDGRIFAIQKRLREIPQKLSDLFKDIVRRDCVNMDEFLLCLQWILFARKPLELEEFYFAMVAGDNAKLKDSTNWDTEQNTPDYMRLFMLSSSKGLAELTKSKPPTVQFIHESVRDFLLKDGGMCELWPELGNQVDSLSHDRLKQSCQNYLVIDVSEFIQPGESLPKANSDRAKDLRQRSTAKFPFLEYASNNVLYHADEAAREIPQESFLLKVFDLARWLDLTNMLKRFHVDRHTPDATLAYLLAENNLPRLIRTIARSGLSLYIQGERYGRPLFAALAKGHQDAVRPLLEQDGHPLPANIVKDLIFGKEFLAAKHPTPLLWALETGYEALPVVILECTGSDRNLNNRNGQNVLTLAAELGYSHLIGLLLAESKTNFGEYDEKGGAPLLNAAREGHVEVVKLLLDSGVYLELGKDGTGRTALSTAAANDKEMMVQLLIDRGANIEVTGSQSFTPLLCAAEYGAETAVRILLDRGANFEAADNGGGTALMYAARSGIPSSVATVQLLLDKGANIERQDNPGHTALLWAAREGTETMVRLLLDRGADIEAGNNQDCTALTLATRRATSEAWIARTTPMQRGAAIGIGLVQLLLERNANNEAADGSYRVSLSWAAQHGTETMVQLLLDRGADIEAKDKAGNIALTQAVQREDSGVAIVRLLLDRGANIEATDKTGNTALTQATYQGDLRLAIVQLLLDRGANIETVNEVGRTALTGAAFQGEFGVTLVQLLLDRGANIEGTGMANATALARAVQGGDSGIAMVRLLLDRGANIEATDAIGNTALIKAAYEGDIGLAIVQLLLERGANIEAIGEAGTTALKQAAFREDLGLDMVRLLLDRGANIEATNECSSFSSFSPTALIEVARKGESGIATVRLLLGRGANIEATDKFGNTAVLTAVQFGTEATVRLLLDKGANMEHRDNVGQTAYQNAVNRRWNAGAAIAALLLNRNATPA